jgi:Radial spoke protein 3
MVSRTLSKNFLTNLKSNSYAQLADVGIFYNKFNEEVLKTNVLPWLFKEAELYLDELEAAEAIPN